jgi:hypothetical protein
MTIFPIFPASDRFSECLTEGKRRQEVEENRRRITMLATPRNLLNLAGSSWLKREAQTVREDLRIMILGCERR